MKVKEGDYFAAGGWSGKIKRISHENGNNRADNRNFEKGRVPIGETGWGVRIRFFFHFFSDNISNDFLSNFLPHLIDLFIILH